MKRLIPLLFALCIFLWVYPTFALAADTDTTKPLAPYPEDMVEDMTDESVPQLSTINSQLSIELFPIDVQTVIDDGGRQIIKTYELEAGVSPGDIPRESFDRAAGPSGASWRYELADITVVGTDVTDTRAHVETVTLNTSTNDTGTILSQLAPTMEYNTEDGYSGVLTLNVATIKVEQAGTKTSSFNVSATREYPHLSACDTSLLPKTITDNGRTLTLADVEWRAGNTVTVDYDALPEYYTAVATYTGTGSKTVVTGYVTTAEYTGTVEKTTPGKTVCTAIFAGTEIILDIPDIFTPPPVPAPEPEPEPKMDPMTVTILIAACALLLGIGAGILLSRNKKTKNNEKGAKRK